MNYVKKINALKWKEIERKKKDNSFFLHYNTGNFFFITTQEFGLPTEVIRQWQKLGRSRWEYNPINLFFLWSCCWLSLVKDEIWGQYSFRQSCCSHFCVLTRSLYCSFLKHSKSLKTCDGVFATNFLYVTYIFSFWNNRKHTVSFFLTHRSHCKGNFVVTVFYQ